MEDAEDLRSPHAFVGSVMPLIVSLIVVTFITTGRLGILLTLRTTYYLILALMASSKFYQGAKVLRLLGTGHFYFFCSIEYWINLNQVNLTVRRRLATWCMYTQPLQLVLKTFSAICGRQESVWRLVRSCSLHSGGGGSVITSPDSCVGLSNTLLLFPSFYKNSVS